VTGGFLNMTNVQSNESGRWNSRSDRSSRRVSRRCGAAVRQRLVVAPSCKPFFGHGFDCIRSRTMASSPWAARGPAIRSRPPLAEPGRGARWAPAALCPAGPARPRPTRAPLPHAAGADGLGRLCWLAAAIWRPASCRDLAPSSHRRAQFETAPSGRARGCR